jgi:hypothetical protein
MCLGTSIYPAALSKRIFQTGFFLPEVLPDQYKACEGLRKKKDGGRGKRGSRANDGWKP